MIFGQRHYSNKATTAGVTLLELLVALLIIAVLTAIAVPSYSKLKKRAYVAACVANMKAIHGSLDTYVADHKQWPQESADLKGEAATSFYMNTLAAYNLPKKSWFCPSVDLDLEDEDGNPVSEGQKCCYMVSPFGSNPFDPFRYGKQPWIIERYGDHPHGPHVALPDGSVITFIEAYGQ